MLRYLAVIGFAATVAGAASAEEKKPLPGKTVEVTVTAKGFVKVL